MRIIKKPGPVLLAWLVALTIGIALAGLVTWAALSFIDLLVG